MIKQLSEPLQATKGLDPSLTIPERSSWLVDSLNERYDGIMNYVEIKLDKRIENENILLQR